MSETCSNEKKYNTSNFCERTIRRKSKVLSETHSLSVLTCATQISLRTEGMLHASKLLKEATESPKLANKYREACKKILEPQKQMSLEDALSVLVEAKLSRYHYDVLRKIVPERFPSYKKVQAAKKLCYPIDIYVTETYALVSLQSLLNHTIQRLLLAVEPVIRTLQNEELNQLQLISKWGFDGSSGHSSYKQAFCDSKAIVPINKLL